MFDATRATLLEAMGYQLLVRRGPTPAQPGADRAPSPARGGIARQSPPVEHGGPAANDVATAHRPRTARTASGPGDALWFAVLDAAAIDDSRADVNRIYRASSGVAVVYRGAELWVDPLALAGDARAKRGLWKTLRALRRDELRRSEPGP